jgi:hypothetical protein
VPRFRRTAVILALLLGACTHEATSAGPSSPGPGAVAAVCRDVRDITELVVPLLDRMDAGTEDPADFQEDGLRVNEVARRLYRDVAPFARRDGGRLFAAAAGLVADLYPLLNDESGPRTEPSKVDEPTREAVRTDVAALGQAAENMACPSPAGGSTSP